MVITYLPNGQRVLSANHNTDVNVDLNTGDPTLDNEDKVQIGSYEDYTGSGDAPSAPFAQGVTNILQGTDGGILGAKDFDRTIRGNNKETHRTRRRIVNIVPGVQKREAEFDNFEPLE